MTVQFARNRALTPTRVLPWSWLERQRWRYRLTAREAMPPSRTLKPVFPDARWTLVFIYLPSGGLGEAQRFMLARLKALDRRLLVVCAAPGLGDVPAELADMADALCWKGLQGFDFSGYAIGLHAIAAGSPHADVFVLNDSTFGPFKDLTPLLEQATWDLTGFSGSYQVEAHFQSFAFLLRDVTPARMRHLRSVFPLSYSYNDIMPVVMCFETRFARVASRHMTVGCLWYGPDDGKDPSIAHALALLDLGFPFLKRGLLGKHRGRQDERSVRAALVDQGFSATVA